MFGKNIKKKETMKRVRFGSIVEFRIPEDELPRAEDFDDIWYRENDILNYLTDEVKVAAKQLAAKKQRGGLDKEDFALRGLEYAILSVDKRASNEKRNEVYRRIVARDDESLMTIVGNLAELIRLKKFAESHREQADKTATERAKADEEEAAAIFRENSIVLEAFPRRRSCKDLDRETEVLSMIKSFFKQQIPAKAA